jgi:hypothetical protein
MIKSRRMKWVGHVEHMGGDKKCVQIFDLEGKRPLRRLRCRWEDNITTDLKEVVLGVDWIYLLQDRDRWWVLVNAVMNVRVP